MASYGERKSATLGTNYSKDSMYKYAQSVANLTSNILSESATDYYSNPSVALLNPSTKAAMEKFFVENSFDPTGMTPEEISETTKDMRNLFLNDVEGIREATALSSVNPVVGLSLPMHKNIMMNMVFDKGAIPKAVAVNPKFTRTMERRFLVTPEGTRIDMFKEQNLMTAAMENVNPITGIDVELPHSYATTDFIDELDGAAGVDHLDVATYIGALKVEDVYFAAGDVLPDADGNAGKGTIAAAETVVDAVWFPVNLKFKAGYGEIKRQIMEPVALSYKTATGSAGSYVVTAREIDTFITGNIIDDRIYLHVENALVTGARVMAKLDASTRTVPTCTVTWDEITTPVEIGTDNGVMATISPEEVKDITAMYNVNQLTKIMSLMKTAIANRKDDSIKRQLDESFYSLDANSKFATVFDYAPPARYALDHQEWRRKTFMEYFDSFVQKMLYVLNDPNMSVSVFGNPDLIRRITPTEYTYQAPASIGAVDIDFTKTVVTSDKRVYQFVGSDKLRGNQELIVTLCPKNSDRIIYIIYDYQMYMSNEIRNSGNFALPNLCCFERWLFDSYQPVQGRITIANPSGFKAGDGTATTPLTV